MISIKRDFSSSIIVFFVALPLCLGIALASGAPLFSGLIAGVIGGIIVGSLSNSKVGVSGPAAGLAAIVFSGIESLGGFENLLTAIILAGIIQIIFGFCKAGSLAKLFPSSVVKGMLTGIGVLIIINQVPHLFGYDENPSGEFGFLQMYQLDGVGSFIHTLKYFNIGAALIGLVSFIVLIVSDLLSKKYKFLKAIQGPFIAVIIGIMFVLIFKNSNFFYISDQHLVNIPIAHNFSSFMQHIHSPSLMAWGNIQVWIFGLIIAIVASLETLLCVEATDTLTAQKPRTSSNRELFAQGIGNCFSGLLGGLPITQVIVRSTANYYSGGRSKFSTISHGCFLLAAIIFIPELLNLIPLSVLAAILIVIGYKLVQPSLIRSMYKKGWQVFIPFCVTVLGIVFIDLLYGLLIGLFIEFACKYVSKYFD